MTEDTYIRDIQRHDSVGVYESEDLPSKSRETPWEGYVIEQTDDGYLVGSNTDDLPPERVLPENIKRIIGSGAEAVAVLAAAKMGRYGCIDRVETGGRLIQVWIQSGGCNFSNIGNAFDLDAGEIGPLDAYNEDVQEKAGEHTECFANFIARGVRPQDTESWGYGSPTHADGKAGAHRRDPVDLDPLVFKAADKLGLIPEEAVR